MKKFEMEENDEKKKKKKNTLDKEALCERLKSSKEFSSIQTAIEEIEVASDSAKATQWLLRKGASLKIRNLDGYNPLECALNKEENKLDLIKTITYHQHEY